MTDVAIYQPHTTADVVIARPLDDWVAVADQVVRLAHVIADSPFVPDGLRGSVPATAAAILAGRELGIPPMTSLANIHVIKGKTGLSALLMRALVLAQGHQWQDVQVTDTRVVVRGRRKGEAEWTEASFDADQAKRAAIALHPYPQDKLYARATVRLCRRKFADVIAGMPYSAEELEDGELEQQTETTETPAEKPAQRTAQRRTRTPAAGVPAPAPQEGDSDAGPATPHQAPAAASLPPLPGEPDDTDYDTPSTVTLPQLTKIGVLMTELGFKSRDRADRLRLASRLVGRELDSSTRLSRNEASLLIDTIERCGGDYAKVEALLSTGDAPDGTDET